MRRQDAKTPGEIRNSIHPWRVGVLGAHLLRVAVATVLFAELSAAAEMKAYDTPYYTIHTDLDPETEKEAALRLTRMAEEYHDHTKEFAGAIIGKLPFYFFRNPQDYYDNGGVANSAGIFIPDGPGGKLLALANPQSTPWHTLQHEGFHQFAHATIGDELPAWLNEGLAEYFAEGIFTGDGYVIGVVPPWRCKRLKDSLEKQKLKPFRQIMLMSPQQWRDDLTVNNYDQAWSMVHFLVHGENNKYQSALANCIREISRGQSFEKAWLDTLGPGDWMEARWKTYWLSQPENPTPLLYTRATLSILTSFLARATVEKQSFNSFEDFTSIAAAGKLEISPDDWLPPSLLRRGLEWSKDDAKWNLHSGILSAVAKDGTRIIGSYVIDNGRVEHVEVKTQSNAEP